MVDIGHVSGASHHGGQLCHKAWRPLHLWPSRSWEGHGHRGGSSEPGRCSSQPPASDKRSDHGGAGSTSPFIKRDWMYRDCGATNHGPADLSPPGAELTTGGDGRTPTLDSLLY